MWRPHVRDPQGPVHSSSSTRTFAHARVTNRENPMDGNGMKRPGKYIMQARVARRCMGKRNPKWEGKSTVRWPSAVLGPLHSYYESRGAVL